MNTMDRHSSSRVYLRMLGYIVTIATHLINMSVMISRFSDTALQDPNMRQFWSLQTRFVTCWTFVLQTAHAVLGLSCDYLTLQKEKGRKEYKYLQQMQYCRDVFFASLVIPTTFMVPTVFWPIFLYDRELILPSFTSKIVTTVSNHIIHTLIIPFTLWEVLHQPRVRRDDRVNLSVLGVVTLAYILTLHYTHYEMGVYPYPLLTAAHGTLTFYAIVYSALMLLPVYYYLQWPIRLYAMRATSVKAE